MGWEDPLEKGKATHSTPGQDGIYGPWGHKESNTTEPLSLTLFKHNFWKLEEPGLLYMMFCFCESY